MSPIKLSDLRPTPGSHKTERRIGRGHGSGRGKTSGRGTKGQKARSGGHINRSFNGGQTRLSKRLPFLRGMGAARNTFPYRDEYTIVNVVDLTAFEANAQVQPELFVKKGLMTPAESRGLIKILGGGEIDRPLTVHAHKFSASAREKIEAAGGKAEIIPVKVYEKTKRRKDEKAGTPAGKDAGD
ncbi:50S ribosomal protein L15 [Reticulibacter mediterranei]|uniref:Large ribosomal subunit protein uL15 n=1 Tax=Reticulibacter mediterranei TaxID=2778369 RepID=A0A8J3N2E4_9CHLR|nr:50S ribosomal protein L15 [Reticulibacter mediterranei]